MRTDGSILRIQDLSVEFGSAAGRERRARLRPAHAVRALDGVTLSLSAGETLGLVGRSGSGKSTLALTVLGLQPANASTSGRVLWNGRDLLASTGAELRCIRGAEIALVPQDALSSLHPFMRVDRQVAEAVRAHAPALGPREALRRASELLARTGLPPDRLRHAGHPFEWSGGMRQRALIAMAIAHSPSLLIADEPTTALDATTQAEILALLREIQERTGTAILLISHDMDVVSSMADRVAVIDAGRVVQSDGKAVDRISRPAPGAAVPAPLPGREDRQVLTVEGLGVRYRRPGRLTARRNRWFRAVEGVTFGLGAGETLCVVGESGAGKSSLARAIVRLEENVEGRVVVDGTDLIAARGMALRRARGSIQIVFQNPYASLNPRRRVGATIAEPLRVHGVYRRGASEVAIDALLERVGLPSGTAERFPFELSGGERQRVAIARALVLEPRVVVLDEPVSSLDAETRTSIVDLLGDLQRSHGIAYVMVAHDLRFVRRIAHRIAVMDRGRFVEIGPAAQIFERPEHDRTRALIAAVPTAGSGA